MSFELQTVLDLNRDRIIKKKFDQTIRARMQIIAGRTGSSVQRATVNMVFLIDSSGSMNENYYATGQTKRQVVHDAVKALIGMFDKADTISIISFNSNAVVHVDHSPGGNPAVVERALAQYLKDDGGTNFEAAMKMAESVCRRKTGENYKLIFLTDGNSQSGNNDNALKVCRKLAENGITTDAMGIGSDFDFEYMKKYTDLSGSKTENITQSNQVGRLFGDIYTRTSNVFLKKVFINFHFSRIVRDVHFYMHEPEMKNLHEFIHRDQNGTVVQVNAGDVEQESFKEFLFDFAIDTPDSSSIEIGTALIHFDCPVKQLLNQKLEQVLYLNLADTEDAEIIDGSINDAYSDIEILERQNDILKLVEQKKFKEAAVCLEKMAETAARIGAHDKAKHFREMKNKVMRENNVTQEDLNAIVYTSSRSSVKSRLNSQQPSEPLV